MSKLYEARKCTLTKPLSKEEIGYVYNSKVISPIIEDIKKKKYGSYLIGGVVGTGKSSQVEIATNYAIKNPLIIHVKFYNEKECIDEFEKVLLIAIMNAIKEEQIDEELEGLSLLINECEKNLNYTISETEQEEKIRGREKKNNRIKKSSIGSKIGAAVNEIFYSDVYTSAEVEEEESRSAFEDKQYKNTITLTKIQKTQLEYIYKILDNISNVNVVVIYDELDKMNEDILGVLFSRYKELFVEKDIFNFFVVNDTIYKKYSNTNILQNPTYSYFMGIYYVPLLSLEETFRYSKLMFGETQYINGLVSYYLCIGNYRMLNQKYLSSYTKSDIDVIKAYVHKKTVEKLNRSYFNDYMRDVLIRKVKAVIEKIITIRIFEIKNLAEKLSNESKEIEVWPDYETIADCIIEVMKEICPEAIEVKQKEVTVKGEKLVDNYYLFEETIEDDRRETFTDIEKNSIQLSDMYSFMTKTYHRMDTEIPYLSRDIIPLKVADNETNSYREALINILYANLLEKGVQVIVIRRERGEESYYANDFEYTGMVIVDKGTFEIAYYVERGSYDSDGKDAVDGLINEAERLGVHVARLTATERINIEKEIKCIVDRYNNPWSELYEHRKVVYQKWE